MARPIPVDPLHHRNGNNGTHGLLNRVAECEASRLSAGEGPMSADTESWQDKPGFDAAALIRENEQLREQMAEMERLLNGLKQEAEQALANQQREYENLLEEKSELIRSLHRKLHELQERPPNPTSAPREEELLALSEELERDRAQLKEDEAALMEQMGQMEVQMSRERAELARQRSELQRLQNEIRHELERASRDAALRERLAPLQRRQQEMNRRSGPSHESVPVPEEKALPPRNDNCPRDSGIFRRIFG
jgi:chromosome segregation ATPase